MTGRIVEPEQMWAYVHGEAEPAVADEVEAAVCEDPALRAAIADRTDFDRSLRLLMPLSEMDESGLEDRILAGLDLQPEPRAVHDGSGFGVLRFPDLRRSPWRSVCIAAAAATLAVAFGVSISRNKPLRWESPRIVELQSRGAESAIADTGYSEDVIKKGYARLQSAVQNAHEQAVGARKAAIWRLQFVFRVMPRGMCRVEVNARRRGSGAEEQWTRDFSSPGEFLAGIDAMGRDVVAGLRLEPD